MMRRLSDVLRRRWGSQAQPPPMRPNELRRDVVHTERQRREARRTPAAVPRVPLDEATAPRQRPPLAAAQPVAAVNPVKRALQTRSGLRQAWVLAEVLGPPVALRGSRHEDRES